MSSHQPAPPPESSITPETKGEPPASIRTAVTIVYVLLAVSFLSLILQLVFLDEIVDRALEAQGSGVNEDAVRTGAIVGGVFGFLVFGGLYVVLAIFLRKGANWARIVLTVLGALGLIFGVFGLFGDEPVLVTLFRVVTLALTAALLFFMWRPDASAYLKGRPAA
jgi:hypothetical protein